MTWTRLDDKFHSNPKVLAAGNAAAGLYARALSYCGDQLTDGFVPETWAKMNGSSGLTAKLISHSLWKRVSGGYFIPDFLSIGNPSRQQVLAKRETDRIRKESARKRAGVAADSSPPVQSRPVTTGSNGFLDLDSERRRELERIYACVSNADQGTAGVLASYGRQLPFGALAKVRESVEAQQRKVASGWVVNALKSEIEERAA